jgi:hypothetical protein
MSAGIRHKQDTFNVIELHEFLLKQKNFSIPKQGATQIQHFLSDFVINNNKVSKI